MRFILRICEGWWVLVSFAFGAMFTDLILIPLSSGLNHLQEHILAHYSAMFLLFAAYPVFTSVGILGLSVPTTVGFFQSRSKKRNVKKDLSPMIIDSELQIPPQPAIDMSMARQSPAVQSATPGLSNYFSIQLLGLISLVFCFSILVFADALFILPALFLTIFLSFIVSIVGVFLAFREWKLVWVPIAIITLVAIVVGIYYIINLGSRSK
jgi:hypothetical protein